MSADRHKVYENSYTATDILRARGASEKEIQDYRKRLEQKLLAPRISVGKKK